MTHVAFVVSNYPPHAGGVESHVRAVAWQLRRRGHRITVFNCESRGVRHVDGIPVVGIGRRFERKDVWSVPGRGAARVLSAVFLEQGVTHVSTHTRFFPATWLGVSVANDLGLVSILTEHGGGPVRTGSRVTDTLARAIDATWGRRTIRRADRVLAVSYAAAALVSQLADRDPIVCGNGADVDFWSPVGAPETRPVITYAGRLVPEKGWHSFLDIVGRLPAHVTAVIAGDGPDRAAARAAIDRRGLTGRVSMIGQVDQVRLRDVYRGSVYVNPSSAAEGFQTTLLEAALAGATVATYDVGGAREVLESGAVGELVRPGDVDSLASAVGRCLSVSWREAPGLTRYDWSQIASPYEDALGASAR